MKGSVAQQSGKAGRKLFKVIQHTEQYLGGGFWHGLDFVVKAMDKVAVRKYLDSSCGKMIESCPKTKTKTKKTNFAVLKLLLIRLKKETGMKVEDAGRLGRV